MCASFQTKAPNATSISEAALSKMKSRTSCTEKVGLFTDHAFALTSTPLERRLVSMEACPRERGGSLGRVQSKEIRVNLRRVGLAKEAGVPKNDFLIVVEDFPCTL